MRIRLLSVLCLLSVSALAADQKMSCSLAITPLRGESHISGNNGIRSLNGSSSTSMGNTSKTITRNLKWKAEVRFRDKRPEKTELKVYYIGYSADNKLKQIGQESKTVELDKNGRASVELTSPTTKLTKTRTSSTSSSGGRSSGFVSMKKRQSGERVMGCVIQVFADGTLSESYASDSRWAVAAEKTPFSLAEITARSGKIGLR